MTTAKYTVPANFGVVIRQIDGLPHVVLQFDEINLSKANSTTGSAVFAAMRAAMLAAFDAAVKKDVTSNPRLSMPDLTTALDRSETYLDKNGNPAIFQSNVLPADAAPGHEPIISTTPPAAATS